MNHFHVSINVFATATLEACCSGDHRPPLALAALAEFRLVKQGNIDAARALYGEVAACNDADGPSLASAAWFYAQHEGDYGRGRQLLERAVKMCCDDAVRIMPLPSINICNICAGSLGRIRGGAHVQYTRGQQAQC